MSIALSLNIVQNSQNITANTSNVTVSATATWNAKHWNASGLCTGSITINGATYSFSGMSFNTSGSSSGSQTLMTKTVDVPHSEDGSKTLLCSASFDTRVSTGVISATASKTLTTIARKTSLTETPSLTLGEECTLKISKPAGDSMIRVVSYQYGNQNCLLYDEYSDGSFDTELSFTPPMDMARQDPTSEYASFTITIASILDSTGQGQYDTPLGTNTYNLTAKVPDSVVPTVDNITVTETVDDQFLYEEFTRYDSYVQGVSVLKVSIDASGSYGSAIKSYSTTIGGVTYTGSEFLVSTSKLSGTVDIVTTVTDNRGSSGRKSASKTTSVSIESYSPPVITSFTAVRANSDYTKNSNGDYMLVSPEGNYTNIFPNVIFTIKYKKNTETEWTTFTSYASTGGSITAENCEELIGPLDQTAYDFYVSIEDAWNVGSETTTGPGTAPIMHFNKSGNGVGFGKVAELDNVLDIGFQTKFTGGILYPTLEAETDLDTVLTPNTYSGLNPTSANYLNCPPISGSFMLEVESAGADGQLLQRLTRCHKTQPSVYERFYYNDAWGDWIDRGWTDPGWTSINASDLASTFAAYYGDTNYLPRYRRDGRVVEINGQLTLTESVTYSTTSLTIFTLPEGYRPTRVIYALCQGSGTGVWCLTVNSDGKVGFARYRYADNESSTAGVNTWLPFQLTFLV